MAGYPSAPPDWQVAERHKVGPFTTGVSFRDAAGEVSEWTSREHRKHASLLSRSGSRGSALWAPRRASWWIGVLFAIGSACFLVGPFPGFVQLVGPGADGVVFFVGSIFFTSAATLQYLEGANADRGPRRHGERPRMRLLAFGPHRIDWWSTLVQLVGTILFNVSTFDAMKEGLDAMSANRLIWAPDLFGSVCFLISGYLAYVEVFGGLFRRPRGHGIGGRIAFINLVGCVAFGVSALASYYVPETGDVLNLAAANFTTAFGALCFLIGSLMLLAESAESEAGDAPARADPARERNSA